MTRSVEGMLRDLESALELLTPLSSDDEPCDCETPDDCSAACRYMGCIDKKLRSVREALADDQRVGGGK